ncbi:hypothetical protein F2Q69_00023410 [Brassica cretica]|uniref:Uncharacterized protein n=1 Tax=Brassica cretica TaxID=69181 RepID=A0A8S9PYX3_BRACR|nr:hypothetical protein F2Q69_00023410 [Brassica cretica]
MGAEPTVKHNRRPPSLDLGFCLQEREGRGERREHSENTSDDRSLSRSLQRRHVYHEQNATLIRLLPFVVWAVSSLSSGKCSPAILGGQECQALMWLDMLMVDVLLFRCITWKDILFPETKNITIICFQRLIRSKTETNVALLWDPCNRPTDAEALYVPSFQVHQRVCASDAMAVTVPVLIS